MSNRECYGHSFKIHGAHYYRCLLDGQIVPPAEDISAGDLCPACHRTVDPDPATVVRYSEVVYAVIDLGSIGPVKVRMKRQPTLSQVAAEACDWWPCNHTPYAPTYAAGST